MKSARLAVLVIALAAGGAAAWLANRPAPVQPTEEASAPTTAMTKVLVAAADIGIGTALSANDMRWQEWPAAVSSPSFISDTSTPNAIEDWSGAITRSSFVSGEPIRPEKLIKGNGSGFLSAILPAGMRAVATRIAVDTAAGGFILPNDRVDVLLTRRDAEQAKQTGSDAWISETILRNVRVLAIDQTIEDQNGQKVITGSTGTLELLPQQAEVLSLAREMGAISLALRSLADSNPNSLAGAGPETAEGVLGAGGSQRGLNVVRYGISTTVVNR